MALTREVNLTAYAAERLAEDLVMDWDWGNEMYYGQWGLRYSNALLAAQPVTVRRAIRRACALRGVE